MKKILLISILIFTSCTYLFAQALLPIWAASCGGSDLDEGLALGNDTLGNVYMAGTIESYDFVIDQDSLPNFSGGATSRVLITKYNKLGIKQWVKVYGGNSYDGVYKMCVDIGGNCYITGYFLSDSIKFDQTTLYSDNSNYTNFIVKLNSNGGVLWAKTIYTGNGYDMEITSLKLDGSGNLVLTGENGGNKFIIDSDTIINNSLSSSGILAKLNDNGNLIWGMHILNDLSAKFTSIDFDANNNYYTTGFFRGYYSKFGNDSVSSLNQDGKFFLAKCDSNGNFIWEKTGDCPLEWSGINYHIMTQNNGVSYVLGNLYTDSLSIGNYVIHNSGLGFKDFFLIKFDELGNIVWNKTFSGIYHDIGYGIARDKNDNIVIVGSFESPTIIAGQDTISSVAFSDIFVIRLDTLGNINFMKNFGGQSFDECKAISIDIGNHIYLTGSFNSNQIDMGNSVILNHSASNFNADIFLTKLSSQTTGISNTSINTIKIYPNPSSSVINIETQNQIIKTALLDLNGRTIIEQSNSHKQLNISSLPSSLYILKIITPQGVFNQKITIEK